MVGPIKSRSLSVDSVSDNSSQEIYHSLLESSSSSSGASLVGRISSVYPSYRALNDALDSEHLLELEVTDGLREELSTACLEYFHQDAPQALTALLNATALEIWSAPKQKGDSAEMLLIVPDAAGRAETLSLEVVRDGLGVKVRGAYFRVMHIIPERLCPKALKEASFARLDPVKISATDISDAFIEVCRDIGQHPSLQETFAQLSDSKKRFAVPLSIDSTGVPRYSFGVLPAAMARDSSAFKWFIGGAVILSQRIPRMGLLVDRVVPGAFLMQPHENSERGTHEALTMSDAAALGIAPEIFFSGEALYHGNRYDLFVLSRAATEMASVLAHMNLKDRVTVAKHVCSKLSVLHNINIAHGDLKPQNIVSEYFYDGVEAPDQAEMALHPMGTWLIDFGYSMSAGDWQELVSDLGKLVSLLREMGDISATHQTGGGIDLEKLQQINLLVGNPVPSQWLQGTWADDFGSYVVLCGAINNRVMALLTSVLQRVGGTPLFRDPGIAVLRSMAHAAQATAIQRNFFSTFLWDQLTGYCEEIEKCCRALDIFKADVWSLGICLLCIAYGSESDQVEQCTEDLLKASKRDPNVSDLHALKEMRKTLAQGLHQFIAHGLNTISFANEQDAQRFRVLCSLAQACLSADPRQRPSVEEVLDSLQEL